MRFFLIYVKIQHAPPRRRGAPHPFCILHARSSGHLLFKLGFGQPCPLLHPAQRLVHLVVALLNRFNVLHVVRVERFLEHYKLLLVLDLPLAQFRRVTSARQQVQAKLRCLVPAHIALRDSAPARVAEALVCWPSTTNIFVPADRASSSPHAPHQTPDFNMSEDSADVNCDCIKFELDTRRKFSGALIALVNTETTSPDMLAKTYVVLADNFAALAELDLKKTKLSNNARKVANGGITKRAKEKKAPPKTAAAEAVARAQGLMQESESEL